MLNNRAIEIIKDLIEFKTMTAAELAFKFKITTRTVYYDLENINYFLKKNGLQELLKNGKKIFFKTEEKEKVKILVGNGNLLDSQERKDYLVMKLFFQGIIVLNKETKILKVTRKTLEKDIKEIKKEAENYGIELISLPSKGIIFKGTESGIRVFLCLYLVKLLVQKHNLKPLIFKLLEEISAFSDIKTLEEITKKILHEYQLNASIFIFYTFIVMMIADKIISKNSMITENQYDKFFQVKFTEAELKKLKMCIEAEKLNFREQCYVQLMNVIQRCEENFNLHEHDHYFLDVYKLAEDFLNELWGCYFDTEKVKEIRNLPTDKQELRFLTLRLENALYKYRFNCRESWKVKDEFPKRLKELYHNVERISRKYFGELLEEDLERLTYTASHLMEKIEEKERKPKKVVIVHFDLGILLERDFAKQLSSMWHIEVVETLPGYELDEFLQNNDSIDGIITFESANIRRIETKIPVIVLNVFCLEESSKVLFDYGYSKKNFY